MHANKDDHVMAPVQSNHWRGWPGLQSLKRVWKRKDWKLSWHRWCNDHFWANVPVSCACNYMDLSTHLGLSKSGWQRIWNTMASVIPLQHTVSICCCTCLWSETIREFYNVKMCPSKHDMPCLLKGNSRRCNACAWRVIWITLSTSFHPITLPQQRN